MNHKNNNAPSARDVADMLREERVIHKKESGFTEFDLSRIEDADKIYELAKHLVRKMPQYPDVVVGFMSDNSCLSRSIAEFFPNAEHHFVPQDDDVKPLIKRFQGSKKIDVLLVKALISDIEVDAWYDLPHINPIIDRFSAAAIADGRFFPYENSLEVISLIDYDHLHV